MIEVFKRLELERAEREASYVNKLTMLIYNRVSGLSFSICNAYAMLFRETIKTQKCVVSRLRPDITGDFIHIPVDDESIDFDQTIALLLLLEELLSTKVSVYKQLDMTRRKIKFVVMEPLGDGRLTRQLVA